MTAILQLKRNRAVGGATLVGVLAASHAATDIPFSAVSALLPTIQARFGLTESVLALLVATLSFAASVTQPLFGVLADRIGSRMVGSVGVIASSALLSLVGTAPSLLVLSGLLLAGGLASAAMHPAFTSLARSHGDQRPGLAVSLYSAGGTFGVAIGPIALMAVMSTLGIHGTPWLMVPGVILGLAAYVVAPPGSGPKLPPGPPMDRRLLIGPVGLLTAAMTLAAVPFVAFNAAIPLWLVAEHSVRPDAAVIGWSLSVFAGSAAAGALMAGAYGGRMSPRVLVSMSLLAAVVPLFAVLHLEPGAPLYFVAVGASGALLNASLPVVIVTAQDLAPQSAAATAGMLMGLAHGLAGLLYVGVGALQERAGIATALAATSLLLPVAAFIAWSVLRGVAQRPGTGTSACPCPV
jgi:FSR family fosmidomycin resistance protein-like MFS transporter